MWYEDQGIQLLKFSMSQEVKKGPLAALTFESSKNFILTYFQKLMWFYLLATKDSLLGKVWGKLFSDAKYLGPLLQRSPLNKWPNWTDLQRLTESNFYWDWILGSPFYKEKIVWENSIRYPMNENSTDKFNRLLLSSGDSVIWYRNYGLRMRLSAKSLSSV